MAHTTVRAKVFRDNTGVATEIPVILTEFGVIQPLVDYLLNKSKTHSFSWMQKLTQGIGLLLDYWEANRSCFDDPKELFESFVERLYSGTNGENGTDPSGLYWNGKRRVLVRQLVLQISGFMDWMAEKDGVNSLNPWREATRCEEMLNWAAWNQKHNRAFLAHTWDRNGASQAVKRARNILLKKTLFVYNGGVKYFPEDKIEDVLFAGFIVPGKQRSRRIEERLNVRDMLITMLMHYGGVRVSEPFHLYVHDVLPDPIRPQKAYVRIFHPSDGQAPPDWRDATGNPIECIRESYLRGKYGLRPRDKYALSDQLHAGWKENAVELPGSFMSIVWFPTWTGELFLKLWNFYMIQRAVKDCDHPFAFITKDGKPYSIDSFMRAHKRAVERIGLVAAKGCGTTPHGHRHAYGQRMSDAKIAPLFIKRAMHHKSLESQIVYTEPSAKKVTDMLDVAARRLDESVSAPPIDFLKYGFEDVDPLGLFSGPNPKLRRT